MSQYVCVVNPKGMLPEAHGPFPDQKSAVAWALMQPKKKITVLPLETTEPVDSPDTFESRLSASMKRNKPILDRLAETEREYPS